MAATSKLDTRKRRTRSIRNVKGYGRFGRFEPCAERERHQEYGEDAAEDISRLPSVWQGRNEQEKGKGDDDGQRKKKPEQIGHATPSCIRPATKPATECLEDKE